jgi:hypothetical protein
LGVSFNPNGKWFILNHVDFNRNCGKHTDSVAEIITTNTKWFVVGVVNPLVRYSHIKQIVYCRCGNAAAPLLTQQTNGLLSALLIR